MEPVLRTGIVLGIAGADRVGDERVYRDPLWHEYAGDEARGRLWLRIVRLKLKAVSKATPDPF
jgi:hypothetical protein